MPRGIFESGTLCLRHRRLEQAGAFLSGVSGFLYLEDLSFRSESLSREESAVSPPTSRFLADKTGFGMTRVRMFLRRLSLAAFKEGWSRLEVDF